MIASESHGDATSTSKAPNISQWYLSTRANVRHQRPQGLAHFLALPLGFAILKLHTWLGPMNCLFCAANSAPQAKFCSECGSPLYLQICPTCAAVNKKTASRCLTCGHTFALHPDRAVAAAVAQIASSPATSLASDAAVDVKANERKVLLQEIAQEIHRQLEAEQHAVVPNRLGL